MTDVSPLKIPVHVVENSGEFVLDTVEDWKSSVSAYKGREKKVAYETLSTFRNQFEVNTAQADPWNIESTYDGVTLIGFKLNPVHFLPLEEAYKNLIWTIDP